jgi:two-component system sensor histidine kinase BarA
MHDPASLPPPGKLPDEPFAIAGVDGAPLRLEELVDRRALAEMIASFEHLFGVPIRVLTAGGKTLAGNETFAPLCALVNEQPPGARACSDVLAVVKDLDFAAAPISATVPSGLHRCFTGALYRVIPLEYDRRPIGRILLGPFLLLKNDGSPGEPPKSLSVPSPELGEGRALRLWSELPSADADTIEQLGRHVATVLDVILFSGHKALLTSQMHLASVRESYRELCEKNERLEEAYERLKELDRLKSNFLATVSHELRTPLTSIMGYGEMLAEGVAGELNEEQHEFVDTIRTKSEQLLGLIMSLLDLSKLESGTVAVRMSRLPIANVLNDTISTLTPTALKKGVALEIDAAPDLPPILGDAERLRQVFLNLADNALKFTPQGGKISLVARTAFEQPDGEPGLILVAPLRQVVEVRVADTGIGIPEGERTKVFDPFYQIDQSSTREYGGAGLGLSIVKRLVEAHQGNIRVEANDPQGTVFVVQLPAARPSMHPPAAKRTLPPVLG